MTPREIAALRVLERARVWLQYQDPNDDWRSEGGHASVCGAYDPYNHSDCDCGWERFIEATKEYLTAWPDGSGATGDGSDA